MRIIRRPNMLAKNLFEDLECLNLFPFKIHMVDHIAEDLSRFSAPEFLDVSSFEHINYVIKKFHTDDITYLGSTLEESVKMMNASVANEERINNIVAGVVKSNPVSSGTTINLI